MTDRFDARISDAPAQGWVDDELGLILGPGRDLRITGHARTGSAAAPRVTSDCAPRASSEPEARRQPT